MLSSSGRDLSRADSEPGSTPRTDIFLSQECMRWKNSEIVQVYPCVDTMIVLKHSNAKCQNSIFRRSVYWIENSALKGPKSGTTEFGES